MQVTPEAALGLALDHHQAGRLIEAERIYQQIVAQRPKYADAVHLLGVVALQNGQFEIAVDQIGRAIALRPDIAIYHNNIGQAFEKLGQTKEAGDAYTQAIKLDPAYPEPRNNLGNILERNDDLAGAIKLYEEAIQLNPNYAEPHTNLGNVYKDQGDLDAAIEYYRRGIERKPELALLHSNTLLTLHYHRGYSPRALLAEHRRWSERHAAPFRAVHRPHPNDRNPERRLRVGFVSPDLRDHAVARFLLPLLTHLDRGRVEVFAYADVAKPDSVTQQLQAQTAIWRQSAGLNDDQLAALVRQDQIDILVDLASHTAGSRLLMFARKPAPVQVTYLAYCSTTGLDMIDYRLSDRYLDPEGTDLSNYSEKTIHLESTYWCYSAPPVSLDAGPLPARLHKKVTFGCLNNFCKVTHETRELWIRILRQIPDSELLLYVRPGAHRDQLQAKFARAGIDPARISFVDRQRFADYMASFQRIDIGLDPHPYGGGTTTCDSLWMGVPVVSLTGQTPVSRAGLSLLSIIGQADLVAATEDEYVDIASGLARDLDRLATIRAGLRRQMQSSPLMDAPRFARDFEAALRSMWRNWCTPPRS